MLPLPTTPQATLDALLLAQLPRPPEARALATAARVAQGLLCGAMVILRGADGSEAFLEGVVARGLGLGLLLQAMPLAWGLARAEGSPLDEGVAALIELRGDGRQRAERRAPLAALIAAARDTLQGAALLGGWALLLSLPDLAAAARRGLLVAGLSLVALLAAGTLVLLGLGLGRRFPGSAPRWLLAALVVPWLVSLVLGVPEASLPGGYMAAIDWILSRG